MIAIIVSKKDPAGMNIAECLRNYNLTELDAGLYEVEKESIFNENIDKEIEADLFIFATKHQSEAKVPSLSCHVPGNWGKAEFGGEDKKLCIAPAVYLKEVFLLLNKGISRDLSHPKNPPPPTSNLQVTLECTHHGPYLEKPCFFIEIGSSEEQWKNKEYGEVIAKTIINILKNKNNNPAHPPPPSSSEKGVKVVFGIGGPHYCSNFNKVLLRTDIAVGHVCPKYQLENLDKEMILQAISRTKEKVDFVLLDWKGLGKEKQRIVDMLNELNLEFKRTDQIL